MSAEAEGTQPRNNNDDEVEGDDNVAVMCFRRLKDIEAGVDIFQSLCEQIQHLCKNSKSQGWPSPYTYIDTTNNVSYVKKSDTTQLCFTEWIMDLGR